MSQLQLRQPKACFHMYILVYCCMAFFAYCLIPVMSDVLCYVFAYAMMGNIKHNDSVAKIAAILTVYIHVLKNVLDATIHDLARM